MRLARAAIFVTLAAAIPACSALLDTTGLGGGAAPGSTDAAAEVGLDATSADAAVDATVDRALDAPADTAAVDARTDAPADAKKYGTPGVRCQNPPVCTGTAACCFIFSGATDYCYDPASQTCQATSGEIATLACDDEADCPGTQVCCGTYRADNTIASTQCESTCKPSELQICTQTAECGTVLTCKAIDTAVLEGYFGCQ